MALAPLERNLLTILALSARTVLSTERIIDGLWGDRPPAAPRSRVQGLVSTLRRKLGDVLVTRHPGYVLDLAPDACDLGRCEDLARRARSAGSPAETADLLGRALGLWRGEPLDGVNAPGADADRARLTELRVGLLEERFEAGLGLGAHTELVAELTAAVAAHPLRERLAGQLMLALYRCNRQADALRAYQALREQLAEELGADPCSDLRDLHATILRGGQVAGAGPGRERAVLDGSAEHAPAGEVARVEPSRVVEEHRPAQMPASVGHFTGRRADLGELTAALPGPDDEPRVLVVSGAGGLGKTALVVRWAHSVADRFPDGQIFVDLRGGGQAEALSPGTALGAVLLALGVAVEQLPVSSEERATLYRTLVHDRRVLLVADDVGSVAQLLPLVPPTPGSLVVATSRRRLTALTAHHAVRTLAIEPLDPGAAYELLCGIVGPERLRGEDATEVVELCGGWPLALRLAGATLAARSRQTLSSFADELRERVDVLSVADDPRTVRAALADAHDSLGPAAGRLFAQLGLVPGSSVCLQLAAAAAGTSVLRARGLLDELISANLVVETGPDRYWFHDMIWRYARRCGAALTDRAVVEDRVIRWYLAVYDGVARRVTPDADWPPVSGPVEWLPFESDADADRFAAAESPNLPGVLRWVAAHGNPGLAWHLAALTYAADAGLPPEACELGLAAALALDDRHAAGEAHAQLGAVLLRDPLRLDEADGHLTLAAELLEPGDGRLACTASFGLGALRARQGRNTEARAALESGLRFLDPGRDPLSYAIMLLGYAEVLVRSGAVDRGQERFAQAMILCQATLGSQGDRFGQFDRGRVYLNQQLADAYLDFLGRSLDAPRVTGPDRRLARTLVDISLALRSREPVNRDVVFPQQRQKRWLDERYMSLPRVDAADSYRI
ncbi:AfsR/SARP family transcriptional regulator [Longispora fulva]|uniref:DNA-binding SARP family transcriptional activator/tetratricopeptide (TPR) repeat protein n=1 Tax=Longispora fulva TaxID=619741 RepID=A0A8J7G6X3_9ACTN|nr:AfsR/SARP family transcriptional regulator [Longispora fulva]MBG6134793.1 DNA-binding SARP family transcriptional activator/tetratricopeptide (TPR) repeat protein [Longispora fulva]